MCSSVMTLNAPTALPLRRASATSFAVAAVGMSTSPFASQKFLIDVAIRRAPSCDGSQRHDRAREVGGHVSVATPNCRPRDRVHLQRHELNLRIHPALPNSRSGGFDRLSLDLRQRGE